MCEIGTEVVFGNSCRNNDWPDLILIAGIQKVHIPKPLHFLTIHPTCMWKCAFDFTHPHPYLSAPPYKFYNWETGMQPSFAQPGM